MPFHHLSSPRCARAGRSFADSEGDDPSRVGGPADPLLDAADQLSTVISFKDNNTGVARSLQMAAQRVAKDQQGGTGRDLQNAFREIATMCEAISLPKSIMDTTKMLFKRVDEEKILRNKNETAIIAACIFIACKQGRVPRTFKEIVALTSVSKKVTGFCPSPFPSRDTALTHTHVLQDIAAAFKQIDRLFDTSSPHGAASTDLDSLISRICNHLALSVPLQRACSLCGSKTVEDGVLAGRNPITIASSCILFVTTLWGQRVDPKEISKVGGVQDSTIRTGYRYVRTSHLGSAVPPARRRRIVCVAAAASSARFSVTASANRRELTRVTCAHHTQVTTDSQGPDRRRPVVRQFAAGRPARRLGQPRRSESPPRRRGCRVRISER